MSVKRNIRYCQCHCLCACGCLHTFHYVCRVVFMSVNARPGVFVCNRLRSTVPERESDYPDGHDRWARSGLALPPQKREGGMCVSVRRPCSPLIPLTFKPLLSYAGFLQKSRLIASFYTATEKWAYSLVVLSPKINVQKNSASSSEPAITLTG